MTKKEKELALKPLQLLVPLIFIIAVTKYSESPSVMLVLPAILVAVLTMIYWFRKPVSPMAVLPIKNRLYLLTAVYAICFAIEMMLYLKLVSFMTAMSISLSAATTVAVIFATVNLMARTSFNFIPKRFSRASRVQWLFMVLLTQGIVLMLLSCATNLPVLISLLTVFSVLVHVSVSISYSTVKSRQRYIISPLAALIASLLVGTSSFLFNKDISGFSYSDAFLTLGIVLTVISFASLGIRINKSSDEDAIQFDLQTSEN